LICKRKKNVINHNKCINLYTAKEMILLDQRRLRFIRLTMSSVIPRKATHLAAGYDLTSPIGVKIRSGKMVKIDIGIEVVMPHGHCGIIKARSGLALKYQIDVLGR